MPESPAPRLPAYDELPPAIRGGRSAWGLFGREDSVGLLNLQTPERVAEAAQLIRSGAVFSLNAPVNVPRPAAVPARRGAALADHQRAARVLRRQARQLLPARLEPVGLARAHRATAPTSSTTGSRRRTSPPGPATPSITGPRAASPGRAVLIDVDAVLGGAGTGFDPASPRAVTVAELDAARAAAGVEWEPGDVLLLYTGFLGWHVRQEAAVREAMAERGALRNVGLGPR